MGVVGEGGGVGGVVDGKGEGVRGNEDGGLVGVYMVGIVDW